MLATSSVKDKQFQLWEYHVNHGALLLRSPEGLGNRRTVDSRGIAVAGATAEEISEWGEILGKKIRLPEQV